MLITSLVAFIVRCLLLTAQFESLPSQQMKPRQLPTVKHHRYIEQELVSPTSHNNAIAASYRI